MNDPSETWLESADVRVRFTFIGEGVHGDYDPDDSLDLPLLRLDCLVRRTTAERTGQFFEDYSDAEWVYPDQGSICTCVWLGSTPSLQLQYLAYALGYLQHVIESTSTSVKHAMDRLSWLGDSPDFTLTEATHV